MCQRPFFKGVQFLLSIDADPNIQNIHGKTALHYAVKYKYARVARILMNHGAHVLIRDNKNRSPLTIAKSFWFGREIKAVVKINFHIVILLNKLKNFGDDINFEEDFRACANCVYCDDDLDDNYINLLLGVCPGCTERNKKFILDEYDRTIIKTATGKLVSVQLLEYMKFSQHDIERFRFGQIKLFLERHQQWQSCPTAGCPNGHDISQGLNFVCEFCDYAGCICGNSHETTSCEQAKMILAGFKNCPSCTVTTQKISGCDSTTCLNCEAHWWWDTGEEETRKNIFIHRYWDAIDSKNWRERVEVK